MIDDDVTPSRATPAPLHLNGDPEQMSDSQRNRLAGGADVAQRLGGRLTDAERRYVDMLRAADVDPLVLAFRLGMEQHSLKAEHDTDKRERTKQEDELLGLPARVEKLEEYRERFDRAGWKATGAVIGTLIAAAAFVAVTVGSVRERDGRVDEQIRTLQGEVTRLRDLKHDPQPAPWWAVPPPMPTTKRTDP